MVSAGTMAQCEAIVVAPIGNGSRSTPTLGSVAEAVTRCHAGPSEPGCGDGRDGTEAGVEMSAAGTGPLIDDDAADDGLWLFELATRLTRLENAVLRDVDPGLTFRQYRLLRRIVDGATTLTALGRQVTISLPTLSESIDGLVRKGLVERRVDPADRRVANLVLTPLGDAVLAESQARLDELAETITEDLDVRRRAQLQRDASHIAGRVTELLRARR